MEVNGWIFKQGTSIQEENILKSFWIWQYVIGESFLTLRRIFLLSLSMVIRPWTKSLTCDWNGISILWLPSWQPSHYTGWGVLILWSYTTCNNNHKQAVTCTGSLSLYYLKIAFFKAVLYKSVQTYIHLHRSRHTASQSRRKVSCPKSLLWEVKTSHYVLFFNSQFHKLQAPLLHLLVSNDQAHPTACFCLPLQQKQRLHEVPFPWHDGPSGHAQRSQAQQHNPVVTEVNLCAFQLPIWCHNCHPVIVHISVFCAQYEAQCFCTVLPSHYKDTKMPCDQYRNLGIHWRLILKWIFQIYA